MATSRLHKRIRYALGIFWTLVFAWMFFNMQAHDVPASDLESDHDVRVIIDGSELAFVPTIDTSGVGLVFYPGALVEPVAYAPLARDFAEAGFKVIIKKLPFRLAPLSSQQTRLFDETERLMTSEDDSTRWVIGGHSRGGALAAEFAADHESLLAGLLLIGTSHPREEDLSELELAVMKIYGSNDGLASPEEVDEYRHLLPPSTRMIRIEGANHAHFARYGWQLGDHSASISRTAQHDRTVQAVVTFLGGLGRDTAGFGER